MSSLFADQQKREILHVIVYQELKCSDGKGKAFLLSKSSQLGHADFIVYMMIISTAGIAFLFQYASIFIFCDEGCSLSYLRC